MTDKDLKLDSKYNIISRVAQLERRVSELEDKIKKLTTDNPTK
jgi:hypothetical protein